MQITEQLTQQLSQVAEKGGVSTSVLGGLWAWMGTNSKAIGAACAVLGLVVAVLGFLSNRRHERRVEGLRQTQIDNQRINGG